VTPTHLIDLAAFTEAARQQDVQAAMRFGRVTTAKGGQRKLTRAEALELAGTKSGRRLIWQWRKTIQKELEMAELNNAMKGLE